MLYRRGDPPHAVIGGRGTEDMRANVTRAAEGFDRRSFTVAEILRMQDAGIVSEDENFELIEGEIVPMQAKTHTHELIKSTLNIGIARALPDRLWLGVESTIYLSADTFVEPDLVVYPKGIKLEDVKGSDILLAIEVAVTSLAYDRGLKARLYARHGVNEVWVIDAERRRTFIHSGPGPAGWRTILERGREEALTFAALPEFSVQLGSI
jgi:Uma2 family endonuclease